jgi:hypothetical protein
MTFEKPDPSSALTVVCYPTGGASLACADGHVWCDSYKRRGWHPRGDDEAVEQDARWFPTVADALRYARGCGWVGE